MGTCLCRPATSASVYATAAADAALESGSGDGGGGGSASDDDDDNGMSSSEQVVVAREVIRVGSGTPASSTTSKHVYTPTPTLEEQRPQRHELQEGQSQSTKNETSSAVTDATTARMHQQRPQALRVNNVEEYVQHDDDDDDDDDDDWRSARSDFSTYSSSSDAEETYPNPRQQLQQPDVENDKINRRNNEEDDAKKDLDAAAAATEDDNDDDEITALADKAWARSVELLRAGETMDNDGVPPPLVSPSSATLATAQPKATTKPPSSSPEHHRSQGESSAPPAPLDPPRPECFSLSNSQQESFSPSSGSPSLDDAQLKAWRMLEEATEHLEEDAIERLDESRSKDDDDDIVGKPSSSKRRRSGGGVGKGGMFSRIARVSKGMRMLRAMTSAMYSAGGSLDLTAFAGTPIRWHSPHSMLRVHACGDSPLKVVGGGGEREGGGKTRKKKKGSTSPSPGSKRAVRAFRLFIQTQRDFGGFRRAEEAAAAVGRRRQQQLEQRRRMQRNQRQLSPPPGPMMMGEICPRASSSPPAPHPPLVLESTRRREEDLAEMPASAVVNPLFCDDEDEDDDDDDAWKNVSVDYGSSVSSSEHIDVLDDSSLLGDTAAAAGAATVRLEEELGSAEVGVSAASVAGPTYRVFPSMSTPEGRLLAVVRCILADVEPPPNLQKPFNAVLGETARHEIVLADGVEVVSVVEQVSHHPPVTAFHTEGDGWAIYGHFSPRPRLVGLHVEVDIEGKRFFRVPVHAASSAAGAVVVNDSATSAFDRDDARWSWEVYESSFVGFEWHFLPAMYTQLKSTKPWIVRCAQTGLVAEVRHKQRHMTDGSAGGFQVTGRVYHYGRQRKASASKSCCAGGETSSSTGEHTMKKTRTATTAGNSSRKSGRGKSVETMDSGVESGVEGEDEVEVEETLLYTIAGRYDVRVTLTDVRTGETGVLYDAIEAAVVEASGIARSTLFHLPCDEKATELVWGDVVRAMDAGAWDEARAAKKSVEQSERVERRRRQREGEIWTPKIFDWDAADETWTLKQTMTENVEDVGRGGGADSEKEPLRAPSNLSHGKDSDDTSRHWFSAASAACT